MLPCCVVIGACHSCSISSPAPRARTPKQWHACASEQRTAESSSPAMHTPAPDVLDHLWSSSQAEAERAFAPADRTRVYARCKTGAERASKRARTSNEVFSTQQTIAQALAVTRQATTPQVLPAERCTVPSVDYLPLRRWQQRPHTRLNALIITLVPLCPPRPWTPRVSPRLAGWQFNVSIGVRRPGPLGSKQSSTSQCGMPMRHVSRLPLFLRREGHPLTSSLIGLTPWL